MRGMMMEFPLVLSVILERAGNLFGPVEVVSRRPQVQERMTEEIADLLMEQLDARGVGVILEATHSCMTIRGIRKANSMCTTSAMRGGFKIHPETRAELMALIYGAR